MGKSMGGQVLTLAADKLKAEGRDEGQRILATTIQRLKKGETVDSIRKSGVDEKTISLALSCH